MTTVPRPSNDNDLATAVSLLEYALHLRMHGERAPGGNETWQEFDQRCEAFLRRLGDAREDTGQAIKAGTWGYPPGNGITLSAYDQWGR